MKLCVTFPPRRDGSYGSVNGVAINSDGTVEIAGEAEARRMLATGNFSASAAPDAPIIEAPAESTTITDGEQQIDLMSLDKAGLLAIARDSMGLDVDGRTSEKSLRAAILDFAAKD
jgi:hypothetical protein